MFKRRDKRSLATSVREFIAPRRGWRRVIEYWRHRMQRLPDTPARIALGIACGVFASFTPFFGFHFVIAAALAWIIRGNIFASAIGTFFGNPLTFPFIAAISLEVGSLITGIPIKTDFSALTLQQMAIVILHNIGGLVMPYFIGGLVPGLLSGAGSYFLVKPLIATYQRRRRNKLIARAHDRIKRETAKAAKTGGGKTTGE